MNTLDRPHILLRGALAADGSSTGRISCGGDWRQVHRLRERVDAVAVGANTFRHDLSRLTAREEHLGRPAQRQPLRVVFSGRGRITADALKGERLVVVGEQPSPIACAHVPTPPRLLGPGLRTLRASFGVRHVLLEGGPTLWRAALSEGVVDDIDLYVRTHDGDTAVARAAAALGLSPAALQATPFGAGQLVTAAFNPAREGHSRGALS